MAAADAVLSPSAILSDAACGKLWVACQTARQVVMLNTSDGRIDRKWPMPDAPTGMAWVEPGRVLAVTGGGERGVVTLLGVQDGAVVATLEAGHTPMAPVAAAAGETLFVCNRFDDAVQCVDLVTRKTLWRAKVRREPVAAAITLDGRHLLVANHLPAGRADVEIVAAVVSVLRAADGHLVKELQLPSGSTLSRGVAVSPDGHHAAVTHVLGRFRLPPTQPDRGWIFVNVITLIDLSRLEIMGTISLDDVDAGAANPWGVAWSADGKRLVVAHAGTHELSVVDAPALLARLETRRASSEAGNRVVGVSHDLTFLQGIRRRVKLGQQGPREVSLTAGTALAANFFSDSVSAVALDDETAPVMTWQVGPPPVPTLERRGEMVWNDGTLCYQGWLSCASCHSADARVDGLNWDNLNDGIGNPKNSKSLLYSFVTPPTTALGARENAQVSVRAGIRHALFTVQPETVALALDAYLASLRPLRSPLREKSGGLSAAAMRGKAVFESSRVGCAECHRGAYFTDLKAHDVGTVGELDKAGDRFDTPTLIELWRTAPYLHDGSAATLRDVLTSRNAENLHGDLSGLHEQEIQDLCAYVLSL